jgi:hypothetical protein
MALVSDSGKTFAQHVESARLKAAEALDNLTLAPDYDINGQRVERSGYIRALLSVIEECNDALPIAEGPFEEEVEVRT